MARVNSEPPSSSAAAGPSYSTASMLPTTLASTPTLPPPFGPSSAYAQTSQARNWRFSPSQLAHIRSTGNTAARKRLETLWAEENSSSPSTIPFLSVDDELALITYYLIKVGQIVRAFSLPELVESTATTFVKRFYLRNTCMDFHPKNIVITCIFLASKAENYPLSLNEFARKLAGKSVDPAVVEENKQTVLGLEFLVSQSLNFEYGLTGAQRGLYGLILDLQSVKHGARLGREEVHKLAAEAHSNLRISRLTDAEFIYTPAQIALACVRAVQEPNGREVVGKWLDAKELRARSHVLEAKKRRQALREAETARAAKAKIALARRTKGKAGAKAAEDEIAAAAATAQNEVVEFDDALLEAQPLGMAREELEKVLDEIEDLIKARENGGFTGKGKGAEDLERIKEIDKRQKQCMNPEKVPGSKLFNKRQAAQEDTAAGKGKRARKSEEGKVDSDDDEVPVAKDFAAKPEPAV
ncbi:related to Cyclin H [Ustilago sp. UG-2017a]|nr:related to Cyclin H [Ustilago sp. UG-2017a]